MIDPCLLGFAIGNPWQQASSVLPDPTKPPLRNNLTDTRLKRYFPIRVTYTLDGAKNVYEFADPDTWRVLKDEDGSEGMHVNGRMFLKFPGSGWTTADASFGEAKPLLNIGFMFALVMDDPASSGLESLGRQPCIVATEKQCDAFLRLSPESFKAWVHTDAPLVDHWESGGDSLDAAYNVSIDPISQPATFYDLDEEIQRMMRANGL